MNADTIPLTPLQLALRDGDAPTLLRAHAERLAALQQHCTLQLGRGLAPADYAACQRLLAMCRAGQRVLQTLSASATAAASSLGPAAGLPFAPTASLPSISS